MTTSKKWILFGGNFYRNKCTMPKEYSDPIDLAKDLARLHITEELFTEHLNENHEEIMLFEVKYSPSDVLRKTDRKQYDRKFNDWKAEIVEEMMRELEKMKLGEIRSFWSSEILVIESDDSLFDVRPCRLDKHYNVESGPGIDENKADFWAVYRNNSDGTQTWIVDCISKDGAERCAFTLMLAQRSPIKPTLSTSGKFYICPTCNLSVSWLEQPCSNIIIPHCKWCGQKLDWEDEPCGS